MSFPNYEIESIVPNAKYGSSSYDETELLIENGKKKDARVLAYNDNPHTRVCLSGVDGVSVIPAEVIASRTKNSMLLIKPGSTANISFVTSETRVRHELVIVTRPLS
ncbi:MAG: hypothetical protein US68_C0008G0022 [Candidatus Shapirobacteria bacterium GW2011_GWE1_38_10]|uniref:Uncharacterized protein n=1 Tax=Candidatus Shapirobacteria bacterium GW2011_GWE1_38_10 TaxID=1618488 RepID=A0A0G0I6I2_9BACT|nr:MAG: hypothetical protein US46_C0006G0123 [Candidatus Shapirobacteria bacterium GW2011_GWF2_37_20]KKQ50137.1 MAG: hypothetical protein US68_C0008G0022 [Candidatus Shapirobacteria bacterium GW2011_GWE1_38_10]HBP51463.1 hypothetical protein [Candidatus Shapirobacteria bacterium]